MFKPLQYDTGKLVELPFDTGETTTKFCVVVANTATGYYATGAAGADDVRYIAMEAVTTTANGQMVLCLPTDGVRILADTSDAPVRADDVGTFVDLATSTTLALGTSTDDIFFVEDIYGPTTDKTVIGYFVSQIGA